jgi:Spy/CpxP family protein refolding chaperone
MRKTLIMLAAAASALVVASPAAAQYYGGPVYAAPAYGAPAYGYRQGNANPWARELQQIRYQANNLARQGRLTRSESRDLFRDIQRAERVINRKSRYGLSRSEARSLNERIGKIRYELRLYSDRDGRRYRRW